MPLNAKILRVYKARKIRISKWFYQKLYLFHIDGIQEHEEVPDMTFNPIVSTGWDRETSVRFFTLVSAFSLENIHLPRIVKQTGPHFHL